MMLAYMDRRGVPYAHTAYSYTPSAELKTLVEPQASAICKNHICNFRSL